METPVWIVEHGEYSSRYVSGAYSSEENAKIAAGTTGDVEKIYLDMGIAQYREGLRPYSVEMYKNGDVKTLTLLGFITQPAPSFHLALTGNLYPERKPLSKWTYDHIAGTTWARDELHAVKIANEHRVQFIASGEWDETEQRWIDSHKEPISKANATN